jgi:DNA processing protein
VANCFRLVTRFAPTLDVRGTLPHRELSVAIVGARAAREADLGHARRLAEAVVARDGLVVSGGALGVDGAAHAAALAAGGATVVVAATGVDVDYPQRHAALFAAIVASGRGAIISEFARGTLPHPGQFIARNAVIAAIADLVIVIGAGPRSGALHTVRAAQRLGRVVAAVPGAPGCDRLIAEGAAIVETAADLDRCLAGDPRRPVVVAPPAGSDGALVLSHLSDRDPRDLEDLTTLTGLPLRATRRAIADLELRGLVHLAPGQTYVRTAQSA